MVWLIDLLWVCLGDMYWGVLMIVFLCVIEVLLVVCVNLKLVSFICFILFLRRILFGLMFWCMSFWVCVVVSFEVIWILMWRIWLSCRNFLVVSFFCKLGLLINFIMRYGRWFLFIEWIVIIFGCFMVVVVWVFCRNFFWVVEFKVNVGVNILMVIIWLSFVLCFFRMIFMLLLLIILLMLYGLSCFKVLGLLEGCK